MGIATFDHSLPLSIFFLCQALAALGTIIYGSFFEWTLHRNVMHRKTWISYPFELHAMLHHKLFRHDETFHASNPEQLAHVTFTPRDYLFLLMANTPVFLAVEWTFGVPVLLGGWLACLAYLFAFDCLHWAFHVPKGRFFENWGWFRWLKRHHRLHHRHHNRNLNVVLPLADWLFRTRISALQGSSLAPALPGPPAADGRNPQQEAGAPFGRDNDLSLG